ncbi:MAG: UDP-3-O-(3-hydroxymyristoyl)glucosamine N-acyltransferase [Pseudomonadota bacterium]
MSTISLGELAERFGLTLRGDPEQPISGLATLAGASHEQLSFLANPSYISQLESTSAGAVVLSADNAERYSGNALISPDPYVSWAHISSHLNPAPSAPPGIHDSAVIGEDCIIDASASIGPNVSIGSGVRIGSRVVIGPGCVIEDGVTLADDARLVAQVFIGRESCIGERVLVHPGVVIGADGFGLAFERDHWIKVPQIGRVIIGADCEIGANTTIDRGAIEDTVLGDDVRLDNQVQIAHNVRIGDHTAIAGCTGVAGSTTIGRYCMIAGASGIGGHLDITDKVVITAMSTVLDSIHEPGHYGSGIPARPQRQWQRLLVRLTQLDDWFKRFRKVERRADD